MPVCAPSTEGAESIQHDDGQEKMEVLMKVHDLMSRHGVDPTEAKLEDF
jgi:alanine racemase